MKTKKKKPINLLDQVVEISFDVAELAKLSEKVKEETAELLRKLLSKK